MSPPEEPALSAPARLAAARRVVVKIGSALLIGADGEPDARRLAGLAADIAALRARGAEAIVVSSGAIALGRRRLGLEGRLKLAEKQAAAAAGQALLMQAWQGALAPSGAVAAQLLLTLDDTENRRRYLNARATLETLLGLGAVPIVNENDTVATAEIRYGDNDRLSAHAAQMAGADLLVMLSDVDGLYTADPRRDAAARHIPLVETITPEIERMGAGANAEAGVGSGGMATKIAAAKIALAAGCAAIIARGDVERPLEAIAKGARATLFVPRSTPERARLAWIGGRLRPAGTITVDAGAAKALLGGASLLPAGVVAVEGDFRRGDAVAVRAANGEPLGQGLCAYDAAEARRLVGKKSHEIEEILGYRGPNALIHRDDLAIARRNPDK
ncbi:glutamate 5-kinase [Amphiplicatus metriothermophilus]|uniref:Glutamate 5-kinase n=1 Tax=Amphiplicatus metriothermophilus TaxID=1519374 RepID=A0A239PQ14_9PROT|nr:glutamate 5-kinase [Amphiplicatus metriothermophilus]MBB5518612.1 glutamate 5-kinase [Amphiplicatus metriothermophilus]SNT72230.1 glutamate 5-kinase [Amphiplicatus metriothermophilus]